jgi:hypothetical protein
MVVEDVPVHVPVVQNPIVTESKYNSLIRMPRYNTRRLKKQRGAGFLNFFRKKNTSSVNYSTKPRFFNHVKGFFTRKAKVAPNTSFNTAPKSMRTKFSRFASKAPIHPYINTSINTSISASNRFNNAKRKYLENPISNSNLNRQTQLPNLLGKTLQNRYNTNTRRLQNLSQRTKKSRFAAEPIGVNLNKSGLSGLSRLNETNNSNTNQY